MPDVSQLTDRSLRRQLQRQRAAANRPPLPPSEIEGLVADAASVGCTIAEIALLTRLSEECVRNRYSAMIAERHTHARMSLRRRQYQIAMQDRQLMAAAKMAEFLGINELAQTDRRADVTTTGTMQHAVVRMSAAQIREALAASSPPERRARPGLPAAREASDGGLADRHADGVS